MEHWISDVTSGRRAVLQMEMSRRGPRDEWSPFTPYPEVGFTRKNAVVRLDGAETVEAALVARACGEWALSRFARAHRFGSATPIDADVEPMEPMEPLEPMEPMEPLEAPEPLEPLERPAANDGWTDIEDLDDADGARRVDDDGDVIMADAPGGEDGGGAVLPAVRAHRQRVLEAGAAAFLLRWMDSERAGTNGVSAALALEVLCDLEGDTTMSRDLADGPLAVLAHSMAMHYRAAMDGSEYLLKQSLLWK